MILFPQIAHFIFSLTFLKNGLSHLLNNFIILIFSNETKYFFGQLVLSTKEVREEQCHLEIIPGFGDRCNIEKMTQTSGELKSCCFPEHVGVCLQHTVIASHNRQNASSPLSHFLLLKNNLVLLHCCSKKFRVKGWMCECNT